MSEPTIEPDAPWRRDGVDLGLLALRLFAGLSIAFAHGINKLPPSERFLAGVVEMGFPFPVLWGWAAGFSEFFGGILVALGLFTRPASFFIICTMFVASFIRQAGDPYVEREPAMLFGAVAICFLLAGPGRFSLDAVIRGALGRRRHSTGAAVLPR